MKRAIENAAVRMLRLWRQTCANEAARFGKSQNAIDQRAAASLQGELADLDAAIKLLEAASAVRELVRAVRADRDAHATFHAATAGAHDTADAADNWPELLGECQRASLALDTALADPTLRALIDESAAGAGEGT